MVNASIARVPGMVTRMRETDSYYDIDWSFTRSGLDGALAGQGNSRRAGEGEAIDAAARTPERSRHENT